MSTPSPLTRDGFIQAQDAIAQAAEEKAAQRQHAKKKLTARERLSRLFDDGVWHEVGQFIGGSVREGRIGSAVAAGYGRVQGRMVAAYAQDFSVLGGTLGKVEGDKIVDLIDRGIRMRIPIVGIQDSGGARIQEGVVALAQYGRIFRKTCEASVWFPRSRSSWGLAPVVPSISRGLRLHRDDARELAHVRHGSGCRRGDDRREGDA